MEEDKKEIDIIKLPSPEPKKVRPYRSANALFHFMKYPEYLEEVLSKKALIPRYCQENIAYLGVKIEGKIVKDVAYPVKCFCDIPLHGILSHMDSYGHFGIGMSKEWGEKNGLQPIQYINPASPLANDFREAFSSSM